jgi:hypothetical protein
MFSTVVAAMFSKASAREEGLVAGDGHFWKREQPREHALAKN